MTGTVATAKYLREFKGSDTQIYRDPPTMSEFAAFPEEGVIVGWATDRQFTLKEGALFGFELSGDCPVHIARAVAIVLTDPDGRPYFEPKIVAMVWGLELGHVYTRYVEANQFRWVRSRGELLDDWIMRSDDFCIDKLLRIRQLERQGSLNDRHIANFLQTAYGDDTPSLS